jgi:mersacidin/lichenicidin family type 2 lantibiotic
MKPVDVIRAWKDPAYREALNQDELHHVPANPAGLVELTDEQLKLASGLAGIIVTTFKTCTDFTVRRYQCCK